MAQPAEAELAEVPSCAEEQAAEAEAQSGAEGKSVDVPAEKPVEPEVAAAAASEVPAEAEVQQAEIAASKVVQAEADEGEQEIDVVAAEGMTELVENEDAATAAEVPAEAEVQQAEIAVSKVVQAETDAGEQKVEVVAPAEMAELVETEAAATAAAPAELVDVGAEATSGDDAVAEDVIAAEALVEGNSAQATPAPAEDSSAAFAEANRATVGPAPIEERVAQEVTPALPSAAELAAEQKAARVTAALKARGKDTEQSPFSVVVSQVYEGPLDLLLDLIRKQDIDIYDIPIAKITAQFLAYVDQLKASDMDVAGEFIYTAALPIHIKSKMLLPRAPAGPEEAAEDPRRELVERRLEHERFKNAAQMLKEKQMLEAATWTNPGAREFREEEGAEAETAPEIAADTVDLVRAFRDILERARNRPIIDVDEDAVTVSQMIQFLARRLTMEDKPVALRRLLSHTRSERALIAMFLALLELVRLQAILLRQDRQFSEIFIKKHTGFETAMNQGLANARDDWR